MVKPLTQWSQNSVKNADAIQYSSASVLSSSVNVTYTSSTVAQNADGKPNSLWISIVKPSTAWQFNTAFYTNQYALDSGLLTYDSVIQTYDGTNGLNNSIGTKPMTAWVNI
jgi:hypothetical protein